MKHRIAAIPVTRDRQGSRARGQACHRRRRPVRRSGGTPGSRTLESVEAPRAPNLTPERERLLELGFDLRPRLSTPARLQHHAQDAVDAEPGMSETGVGVARSIHLVFGPRGSTVSGQHSYAKTSGNTVSRHRAPLWTMTVAPGERCMSSGDFLALRKAVIDPEAFELCVIGAVVLPHHPRTLRVGCRSRGEPGERDEQVRFCVRVASSVAPPLSCVLPNLSRLNSS